MGFKNKKRLDKDVFRLNRSIAVVYTEVANRFDLLQECKERGKMTSEETLSDSKLKLFLKMVSDPQGEAIKQSININRLGNV